MKRTVFKLKTVLIAVFFSPVVLFAALIRPVITLRFGIVDASRIGHFCNLSGYICRARAKGGGIRTLDFISCSRSVCNQQLKTMYSRVIKLIEFETFVVRLLNAMDFWVDSEPFRIRFPVDDLGLVEKNGPVVHFTTSENRQGAELLEKLGIPQNQPWVCMHNRDSAYLKEKRSGHDWAYHDFRDFSVNSLLPAALELVDRGYYVVRMGAVCEEPMTHASKAIIDYANHDMQSDFADIFLLGNCQFYLGSDSGIFAVSAIFNRPFAFVNFPVPYPVLQYYAWNTTPLILKKMRSVDDGHLLSIKEIYSAGLHNACFTNEFADAGVELLVNTPEEIKSLAAEVEERLRNVYVETDKNVNLQDRFRSILTKFMPNGCASQINARLGADFLRENDYLLS